MCLLTGPRGEPKITHGNTFVSDLTLEEVARTIDVRITVNSKILAPLIIQHPVLNALLCTLILARI